MSYLIWSHQHNAWWRPDARGYTGRISEAGRYTREQADQALGWGVHREWLDDGRPHEVLVEAPDTKDQHKLDELLALNERIEQATTEAVVERAGRQVKP
ncbi:MAG: hypothetical protein ABW046_07120 [Actinoplanes sp.]